MKTKLIQAYIQYTLEQNQTPANVYSFAKHMGITEQEFYGYFSALDTLESEIFQFWFDETMQKCSQSEPWNGYSSREKVLAIFYTFVEDLKTNRTFVQFLKTRDWKPSLQWPAYLKGLHQSFLHHLQPILKAGMDSTEIQERKYIDSKYSEGLWLNLLFVLKFWTDDTSPSFEKTDAAIEKSVNLAMDLMGKGPLDAALDFGKFLFQNR